jgi:hypothetical protein
MSTILLEEADTKLAPQSKLYSRSCTAILLFGLVPVFLIKENLVEKEPV